MELWTQDYDGSKFSISHPETNRYTPQNIAHNLGATCRYGGSTFFHYSVAEHSCLIAEAVFRDTGNPVIALDALFHDAEEYATGDMKSPLKAVFPEFKTFANKINADIRHQMRKYELIPVPSVETSIVKEYDARIVVDEKSQALLPGTHMWNVEHLEPLGVTIQFWDRRTAKNKWIEAVYAFQQIALQRMDDLVGKHVEG